jgi:hypothetical protein
MRHMPVDSLCVILLLLVFCCLALLLQEWQHHILAQADRQRLRGEQALVKQSSCTH